MAIVRETQCSTAHAVSTLDWIEGFIDRARRAGYRVQLPTTDQMATPQYRTFEAIIPHGASSHPGSAHEAVERALLDPSRDEFSLVHNQTDEPGTRHFCTVQVCIGVMRS